MRTVPRAIAAWSLAVAMIALVPAGIQAQDEASEPCKAIVSPMEIPAGSQAVQITLNLSQDVGPISGLESTQPGALSLADPADLPRTEMAAEAETPKPIEMSGANVWRLWINTVKVEPGEQTFAVMGAEGRCTATVTIQPKG